MQVRVTSFRAFACLFATRCSHAYYIHQEWYSSMTLQVSQALRATGLLLLVACTATANSRVGNDDRE